MEGDARQIASPADDSANSRSLCVLWRFSSEVVGATGFEPATPCAQGRCATRLRYAPTRQEYPEKRAQRHDARRPRASVALCVAPFAAPSGEGRRIWRALAMISASTTWA